MQYAVLDDAVPRRYGWLAVLVHLTCLDLSLFSPTLLPSPFPFSSGSISGRCVRCTWMLTLTHSNYLMIIRKFYFYFHFLFSIAGNIDEKCDAWICAWRAVHGSMDENKLVESQWMSFGKFRIAAVAASTCIFYEWCLCCYPDIDRTMEYFNLVGRSVGRFVLCAHLSPGW